MKRFDKILALSPALFLLLLLCLPAPRVRAFPAAIQAVVGSSATAFTPIALVSNGAAGSTDTNGFTSGAINTTGANFLTMVSACYYGADTPVFSDSKSNSWSDRTAYTVNTNRKVQIHYVASATVGSGHTFIVTGNGSRCSIAFAAFSLVHGTPYDTENGASGTTISTLQPGTLTPALDNSLIIEGVLTDQPGTIDSINGGFAITDTTGQSDNHKGVGLAYLIQTTKTAANPPWTFSTTVDAAASQASFKHQ